MLECLSIHAANAQKPRASSTTQSAYGHKMSERKRGYFVVSQVRLDGSHSSFRTYNERDGRLSRLPDLLHAQGVFWDPNQRSNTLTGILQGDNDGDTTDVSLTNGGRSTPLISRERKRTLSPRCPTMTVLLGKKATR